MKTLACGIIILLLLTSMFSSTFIVHSVKADTIERGNSKNMDPYQLTLQPEAQLSTNIILSPQNKTYTANNTIPLTLIIDGSASWIGYSLNGQTNTTITGNTTLPTLPDGRYNFVVYTNDTYGNIVSSPTTLFTVDTTAPTGAITVNGGATSTIDASVILTLSAQDATSGVAQMRFFDFTWGNWEDYSTSKLWTFTEGNGYKTVYAQFRDSAGLISTPYRVTVSLGTAAPPEDSTVSHGTLAEKPKATPNVAPQPSKRDNTEPPQKESPVETPATSPSTLPTKPVDNFYFLLAEAGIITAIAIVGVLFLFVVKKRR
jgi:hypothetical protein